MICNVTLYRKARFWLLIFLLAMVLPTPSPGAETGNIPLSVRRVVLQAQQLMEKKQFARALTVLDQQLQRPQHHYLIDFTAANVYLLSERKGEAIPHYLAALQRQPHHAASWINLAQCYYATGQYHMAAQAFAHGYEQRKPLQPQLLFNAALCYLQGDEARQALPLLLRLIKDYAATGADSSTAAGATAINSWRGALVQVYLRLKQPEKAIAQLERLTKTTCGDDRRRWRELLVQQYMARQMNDKALTALNSYVGDDGLTPRWWLLLTHLHLEAGRYPQALVTLKVLACLRSLNHEEERLLADLYLNLGVPAQAVIYYQRLQQRHPVDKQLLTRLAYTYLNLHQPDQALVWAQKGSGGSGENGVKGADGSGSKQLLRLQAQLLFDLGRYAQAVEVFGQLARQAKDPGPLWLMQGYAAWNGELWPQARKALRHAQHYPAQRQRATQLLRQLRQSVSGAYSPAYSN